MTLREQLKLDDLALRISKGETLSREDASEFERLSAKRERENHVIPWLYGGDMVDVF